MSSWVRCLQSSCRKASVRYRFFNGEGATTSAKSMPGKAAHRFSLSLRHKCVTIKGHSPVSRTLDRNMLMARKRFDTNIPTGFEVCFLRSFSFSLDFMRRGQEIYHRTVSVHLYGQHDLYDPHHDHPLTTEHRVGTRSIELPNRFLAASTVGRTNVIDREVFDVEHTWSQGNEVCSLLIAIPWFEFRQECRLDEVDGAWFMEWRSFCSSPIGDAGSSCARVG